MARYLGRRLLLLLVVIYGVITIAFILMHLTPGDPVLTFLGDKATPQAIAALRHQWGLDQSLGKQYLRFLGETVTGQLGDSVYFRTPIVQLFAVRLPVTLSLMVLGAVAGVLISVPLAMLAATRPGVPAQFVRIFNAVVQGMPSFFIGSMLIVLLGLRIRLFPAGGYGDTPLTKLYALILPAITLGIALAPLLVRSMRASMTEVLSSEFVAFGRSKGLGRKRLMISYVLRNSSISGVSILGIQVGGLAGGALVTEQVFALPGMGSMLMTGILNRDYPVVQACTLVFAILVVLVYLATDLVYALLDPRVRLS
ncbi:ABC transporter permease [Microlunatus soli]|uniref:Peptide/nickel transport system permease protein n=1 Tax=Microlunatus soli TaxID=630515 RepID=A0A1H1UFS9_9ACTN|nr:ABC transporter permease [Microlunatus soli]SDS71240.1 peptide/nickel transport system permease protein [Microlunatus soli]